MVRNYSSFVFCTRSCFVVPTREDTSGSSKRARVLASLRHVQFPLNSAFERITDDGLIFDVEFFPAQEDHGHDIDMYYDMYDHGHDTYDRGHDIDMNVTVDPAHGESGHPVGGHERGAVPSIFCGFIH